MYSVKEIFYTLQGEGAQAGRAAVFLRFSGCNLWSGRELDRPTAICDFCDTDFVGTEGPGGGKFGTATELARAVAAKWPQGNDLNNHKVPLGIHSRFVVCTGGEPLLQLDAELIEALHDLDFSVAVETNGTVPAPPGIDWLCVSPKAGTNLVISAGEELKLVYPQDDFDPAQFLPLDFHHFYLQPRDGPDQVRNQALVAHYCLEHPAWRVSLQLHKILGLR